MLGTSGKFLTLAFINPQSEALPVATVGWWHLSFNLNVRVSGWLNRVNAWFLIWGQVMTS